MKKKLVISGCSWTDIEYEYFNPSVNDNIITKKEYPNWAQLLAKKLDMELVCLAKCGFGQQGIFSTIQDYVASHDPKEIGLCIAAWSKSQRANWQKICLKWDDSKPNIYGHVHFWILDSLRYMYAFQTLMENNRIPYRHFQMISLFVDHLYEVEYKDNGIPFRKIYNSCCDVIKTSPYFHKMKNFIGWPIIDECGGFVLGDLQIYKNWGVENKLANNKPNSTYNPANSTYEERQKNSVSEERVHDKDTDMKLLNVEDDGRTLYKLAPKDLVNYDYVISNANTHPNKKGHEWIANYIKLHGFNSQRVQEKDKI